MHIGFSNTGPQIHSQINIPKVGEMTARIPKPAYRNDAVLYGDKELYARIGKVAEGGLDDKKLVEKFEIPIRSGKAWVVKKGIFLFGSLYIHEVPAVPFLISYHSKLPSHSPTGQICTLSTPYGPQVGDLNIFSLHNPRERFWASRTKQLHASHLSVGDRLWSNLPYMRPLVTIVADSLKDYGVDEVGGRCHDLLGTR
jgi:uncharacterized protein YcgI (DUF1989 family)